MFGGAYPLWIPLALMLVLVGLGAMLGWIIAGRIVSEKSRSWNHGWASGYMQGMRDAPAQMQLAADMAAAYGTSLDDATLAVRRALGA